MPVALIALQLIVLLAVVVLLLRRAPVAPEAKDDARLASLLAADLPTQFARLDARSAAMEQHLRGELAQMRADAAGSSTALRGEVLHNISTLSKSLDTSLQAARGDHARQAAENREAIDASREALHTRLNELRTSQTEHMDKLRDAVEKRLDALNLTNAAKLEEMRQTVDEKLHATLQTRLTESFGQVTDQLTRVHAGLGEMTKLSAGVDDLSRIFTNVKSRGTIGEVMLETLLKQMLAANQYVKGYKPRPDSNDIVEFAVKLPTPHGETFLPIDSKFPREAGDRLESAYAANSPAELLSAGKAFETAIRNEGKKICEKYIAPPATTSFAIMFLPTEGLYAEVMRRDGLQTDIQQNCHVTIAGPSTLSAILTSFQMGFHMLQLQQKGDEVWKVLAGAKKEFSNLGLLMTKMEKQVDTVQNTIQDVGRRTRAIDKKLGDVSTDSTEAGLSAGTQSAFDGLLPMLAASDDE